MTSFIMKTLIGNEFDKVMKGFGGNDDGGHDEDKGISAKELATEEKRQAANERERLARRADVEKEREEARQKIRDKYNLTKKDDPPTKTKNQHQGKMEEAITRIDSANVKLKKTNGPEPQGSDSVKTTTGALSSLKRTFGWR